MPRVRLGHNQELTIDGVAYEGVREVNVDVSTRELDVTAWNHSFASSLPLFVDAALTVTLYYPDEMPTIWTKLLEHPKTPVNLSITGLVSGPFVVTGIRVGCPIGGVVAHDVTFKLYSYA